MSNEKDMIPAMILNPDYEVYRLEKNKKEQNKERKYAEIQTVPDVDRGKEKGT